MNAKNRKPMPPGSRYGRLTIVKELPTMNGRSRSLCRCDCGAEIEVNNYDLRSGNTKSCGCLQRSRTSESNRTHGGSRTRLYHIWINMKERCYWASNTSYKNYGARGIQMCPEWRDDFGAFRNWALANGYGKSLTIERKNVGRGYSPDNCCWIPAADQSKNRRMNKYVTINGETMCLADAARLFGVSPVLAQERVRVLGWDPVEAVMIPRKSRRQRNNGIQDS